MSSSRPQSAYAQGQTVTGSAQQQGTRSYSSQSSRSRSRSRSGYHNADDAAYGGLHEGPNQSIHGSAGGDPTAFCNTFWATEEEPGLEKSYEAIMARTKNAGKMIEDFRTFFKERAAIEEDYAKRLAKLARMPLGREETGELDLVLKRVQYELDQSGRCHHELANVIRQSMEARVKDFEASRDARRKNTQVAIERSWKNRSSQDAMVQKAKEKYKNDCILINSFSARLSLTQGKDLDKVTAKLDKAQQTVQVNEAEYKQYCRALKDTHVKWVGEWKSWCDLVQDLEEERVDFVRNALWSYVNAVSLICVKDDESCENVRQVVEACDVAKEMDYFIRKEGTGNLIQDSPFFVDFSDGDKGAAAPAMQPARFARSSAKVEQAPFDGLEKLQTAVYPPQPGQKKRPTAGTSAAPTPVSAAPVATEEEQIPSAQSLNTVSSSLPAQVNGTSISKESVSPVRKASTPAEAFENAINAAKSGNSQPPNPPPPFTASGSHSRPSSRSAIHPEQEERHSSEKQTTAEILQHKASQRLSAAASKPTLESTNDSEATSNYPYAPSSPRAAKPFSPSMTVQDRPSTMRESPSAVLPPPAPVKKEEDPLLAALAKLRSPSSAVDVLTPSSPGVPGNPGLSNIGTNRSSLYASQVQQQQRSHSPHEQGHASMEGRRSPTKPMHNTFPLSQQGPPTNSVPLGASSYGVPPSQPQSIASTYQSSYQNQVGASHVSSQDPRAQQAFSAQAGPAPGLQNVYGQRASSPQPAAAMMRPPSQNAGSVRDVAQAYGQAFPGERRQSTIPAGALAKSQSRPVTPSGTYNAPPSGNTGGPHLMGYQAPPQGARSPSPGPAQHPPIGQTAYKQVPYQNRPQSAQPHGQDVVGQAPRPVSGHGQAQIQGQRPTTPLGIALDAQGAVTQDQMAEKYAQQRTPQRSTQGPAQQSPAPYYPSQANVPPQQQSAGYKHGAAIRQQAQARLSQSMSTTGSPGPISPQTAPLTPGGYASSPAAQYSQQPVHPSYQSQHPMQSFQQPHNPGQPMQRPPSQNFNRSQSMGGSIGPGYPTGPNVPHQQQTMSSSTSYRGPISPISPSQQQPSPGPYAQSPAVPYGANLATSHGQVHQHQYNQSYAPYYNQQQQQPTLPSQQPLRPPSRGPPTGQYTESGLPIQFYVKAIYKYDAATPEEFSFQKDDVICVTETEDDGWWKGELLDPERARRSGGNVFPSNFVKLLE